MKTEHESLEEHNSDSEVATMAMMLTLVDYDSDWKLAYSYPFALVILDLDDL